MRSPLDRLRHAISFEIIALMLIVPLGAVAFHMPAHDIGVVGLVSATLATLWNLVYNIGFDVVLQRVSGTTQKTPRLRVLHAVLFEIGLLIVLMPFIAWYLGVTLWQAFVMDVSFALFYVVYAFGFNWAYDRLFPLAEWALENRGGQARKVAET
ncbi:PACE efflux transporter [Sulfitobacter sp. D35]|uniref:PACE efflux transporter n=1 Tax=Sulfitobacter sp. D35 TaxID=3083252 RepID=UPI00296F5108|nr:PACE efflux transporter [Sulfitobacter sp. D35]MDW4499704.1 PACE efflux transporter [Sulfitobacter sp. D35]